MVAGRGAGNLGEKEEGGEEIAAGGVLKGRKIGKRKKQRESINI